MADQLEIPKEAAAAQSILQRCLGRSIVGIYLFGSWAAGGLRPDSDVDLLVIVDGELSDATRRDVVDALLGTSGQIGNPAGLRPLDVTVVCRSDVVPWRYPPAHQMVYGEWLRNQFEAGLAPAPARDPDLAVVLKNARDNSFALVGPDASAILDSVPLGDVRRGIRDSLPGLIAGIWGDERNVLLTLARMWLTAAEGIFAPKDVAAEWAAARLDGTNRSLLNLARTGYVEGYGDCWGGKAAEVAELARTLQAAIEANMLPRERI